ncbi:MAG: hypothetical protein HY563_04770 [Ignavibacteriales bacterium]|nr:hypothetical protein [Ignavibacteriales bacterium]
MVSIPSLWLPILLSSVFVFLISFVLHTVFTYHFKDFKKAPDEDKAMDALRSLSLPAGEYIIPHADNPGHMKSPEFMAKVEKGPGAFLALWAGGRPDMGKSLIQWFVFSLIVGVFAAYVAGRALGPGEPYLSVFRFAGFTAFACYCVAGWQDSIWFKRSWSRTLKNTIDGLIYGLITAGTFGWLWP